MTTAALLRDDVAELPGPHAPHAVFGTTPDVLTDIYRDDVHLAVWQRALSSSLANEGHTLLTSQRSMNQRTVLSSAQVRHCLPETIPALGTYPNLSSDICLLVEMFSCLFELSSVGLRLSALAEAMCPKFHVDRVPCRLITTYVGVATQWLPHCSVNRSKLGAGSSSLNDDESGLYPSSQHIRQLSPGDVALFKGELWEGNEGAGIVHRSPSVDHDQRRLLLTFDFI